MPTKQGRGSSGKRTTMTPNGDARYVKRDARGRIRESDDVGRAQKADRSVKAKKSVKSGYGDQGDHGDRLELFAEELRLAQQSLSSITGEFTADDLLGEIFSRFCIGK